MHYLPTETRLEPASILQIGHMWHKANNALLRGLRFKAINLSGHVTTLPDAFRRLLGPFYARSFCVMPNGIKLFVAQQGKTFCPPPGNNLLSPCRNGRGSLPMPASISGARATRPCAYPFGLMK